MNIGCIVGLMIAIFIGPAILGVFVYEIPLPAQIGIALVTILGLILFNYRYKTKWEPEILTDIDKIEAEMKEDDSDQA